ncbi:MAG: sensor histidine kinase, partial [Caldimonas sp.]
MSSTPPSPASPAAPPESGWQRFSDGAVRLFHDYGNWLVGITWMRFFVLSLLLLISAAILSKVPPFNLPIGGTEEVTTTSPVPPKPPTPPRTGKHEPMVKIEKQDSKGRDVTISIDKDGVRITPRSRAPAAAASAPASAASAAAS